MTPQEANALGLNWVPDDSPWYGTPGFVGWTPPGPVTPPPVTPPPPLPVSTLGPLIGQPDVSIWPPRPIMAAPGSLNAIVESHARTGIPLPNGETLFTPPLLLRDISILRGSGQSILRPLASAPPTQLPAIILESTLPGNHEIRYPLRQRIEHLIISGHHAPGSRGQVGLQIVGANIGLENVTIVGFGQGENILWGVNVTHRDCLYANNDVGVVLGGLYNSAASGTANVCHVHFTGCRFAHASLAGAIVFHGYRIVFGGCVFENNPGKGLWVTSNPAASPIKDVLARDCWFELNGAGRGDDIVGPVIHDGVTGRY